MTLKVSNEPYPNNDDVISSEAMSNASVAGKLKNKLNSNALLLLIYLTSKEYFSISLNFVKSFFKIVLSTLLTSYIFYNLIKFFSKNLTYHSEYKLMTIISLVIATFIIYILISILTKAFKISDIKLRY